MTKRIPKDILEREVIGLNLAGRTLAGQLTAPVNLLVFLRHFGCVFCREMVADVRNAATQEANYPNVVFFYQGTVEQGQDFCQPLEGSPRHQRHTAGVLQSTGH